MANRKKRTHKVPYKSENHVCITLCPYLEGDMDEVKPRVGSAKCMYCTYYVDKDRENKIVYCAFGNNSKTAYAERIYMKNLVK